MTIFREAIRRPPTERLVYRRFTTTKALPTDSDILNNSASLINGICAEGAIETSVFICGSIIHATVILIFDLYFITGETTWAAKRKSGY
jgi:hypothetical protein